MIERLADDDREGEQMPDPWQRAPLGRALVVRILRDAGRVEKTGITHALHLCRGHFAHYTDDAPLFGKYRGTFYRPLHVRGSLGKGAVLKDYHLHPAAEPHDPES